MTFDELERKDQWYEIDLGKNKYSINGVGVDLILNGKQTFIQLPNNEVINRSFIRTINKNVEKTKTMLKTKQSLVGHTS